MHNRDSTEYDFLHKKLMYAIILLMTTPEFQASRHLEPNQDAWLLADGNLYPCEPPQHNECASWITEHVLSERDKKDLRYGDVHPRTLLEKAGALLVRGGIVTDHNPVVLTNGQAHLKPTIGQLETIERNGLSVFDTLTGQVIDKEIYETAASLLSDRAKAIRSTSWFIKSVETQKQKWEQYDLGNVYNKYSRLINPDVIPKTYEPGVLKPNSIHYDYLQDTESVAHFIESPLERSIHIGDAKNSREEIFNILTEGYVAGMSIDVNEERDYGETSYGVRKKRDTFHFRIVPLRENQCCLVKMHDYYHDGLSRDITPFSLETTITASVLSYTEARSVIEKSISFYEEYKSKHKVDISIPDPVGDSSLLPDIPRES